jgi:endonuclease/exonuclease/phosphatase family metal-dependent hydrolase
MTYLEGILAEQPKTRLLGLGFGLGSAFLLVMVLSQVFTTVYDYIPVVGPFFRDKYWLVFLVPGLVSVLPLLLAGKAEDDLPGVSPPLQRTWLIVGGAMTLAAIIGMVLVTANPSPPEGEKASLRVFTYNIQQGYDDPGERNFDGQIALIRGTSPDLVGLQESDTARIAGGNADVVAYFANRLDMYSYYGPSPITGTFGIALLSKYPIQNSQTYFLYSEGEQVAVIEADITAGGKTFKVYITHLGNGGPMFQIRQMLTLMRGQENVIAMGDYNFRAYEEQYAIAVEEYDDAFMHADDQIAPSTWGTSGVFDIEERIDHVFVSPGTPVLKAQYFTEDESDHPGLFVIVGTGE